MNKYIKSMIEKGMIVGGKITRLDDFTMFQRLALDELEHLDEIEIAFATQSMGRAIFQLDSNNRIINIKGVDSHLDNSQLGLVKLSGSDVMPITIDGKEYTESTHPINLIVQPGKKVGIRIRGTAPLEDIEIEADINSKMQGLGIKLPQIDSVREYPYELSQKLGLTTKITGSYDDFGKVYYLDENNQRKESLRAVYSEKYEEDLPDGLRPEKMSEYFKRIGVIDSKDFIEFAEKNNLTVNDFIKSVDKEYALGQRFGQTVRIMESPFRISDLELYVVNNDIDAIEDIVNFTEELQNESIPFENIFAKQMGTNIALMMNNGWMCENFVHRQDYSLAGEMCDDSFFKLADRLKHEVEKNKNEPDKVLTIAEDYNNKFFSQLYFISSNIKILQDEMGLRGKTQQEIDSVISDFVGSFAQSINFSEVGRNIGKSEEEVIKTFKDFLHTPKDYIKLMAGETKLNKDTNQAMIVYDVEIIRAHEGNNDFYNKISEELAKKLQLDKDITDKKNNVLQSGVEAAETTRTSAITEQLDILERIATEKEFDENKELPSY